MDALDEDFINLFDAKKVLDNIISIKQKEVDLDDIVDDDEPSASQNKIESIKPKIHLNSNEGMAMEGGESTQF